VLLLLFVEADIIISILPSSNFSKCCPIIYLFEYYDWYRI